MDKPTLTPHSDALEAGLKGMLATLEESRRHPAADQRMIDMTLALLPPLLRELAKDRDARRPDDQTALSFCGAMTNVVMSAMGSLGGYTDPATPQFVNNLNWFMVTLAGNLAENVATAGQGDQSRRFVHIETYRLGPEGTA